MAVRRVPATAAEKCTKCGKNVYPIEKVSAENLIFHNNCFKCDKPGCNQRLRQGNYTVFGGSYYCKPHGNEMTKLQGKFDTGQPANTLSSTPSTTTTPGTVPVTQTSTPTPSRFGAGTTNRGAPERSNTPTNVNKPTTGVTSTTTPKPGGSTLLYNRGSASKPGGAAATATPPTTSTATPPTTSTTTPATSTATPPTSTTTPPTSSPSPATSSSPEPTTGVQPTQTAAPVRGVVGARTPVTPATTTAATGSRITAAGTPPSTTVRGPGSAGARTPAATTTQTVTQPNIPAWQLRAQQAKASRLGNPSPAATGSSSVTATASAPAEEALRSAGARPGFGAGVRSRATLYPSSEEPQTTKTDQPINTLPVQEITKPIIEQTPPPKIEPPKQEIKPKEQEIIKVTPPKEEEPKPIPKVNEPVTKEKEEEQKGAQDTKNLPKIVIPQSNQTNEYPPGPLQKSLSIPGGPPAALLPLVSPRGLTRLTSPRVVGKPRGHTHQRSRVDVVGVKSSISSAMARAGNTLNELSDSQPDQVDTQIEALQQELSTLREKVSTLEVVNADALKTIESMSQQKSTLEQNTERIKADLRNQYKENAQIQPLEQERDAYKEKLEKLKLESSANSNSLTAQLSSLQEECNQIRRELKAEKESNARLQGEHDELQERVKVIDDLRTVRDLLQTEKAQTEGTLQKMQKEITDYKLVVEKANGLEEKCKSLESEVRSLKQSRTQGESQAAEKVAALTTEVSRLKSQGDLVEKELKKHKEDIRGAHAEITRLQTENAQLGDSLSKARESLSSANGVNNETTSHITKLETELDTVKVHRDKLSFELQQAQSNLKLVTSDSERLTTQLHKELTAVTEERSQLDAQLKVSLETNKENENTILKQKLENKSLKEELENLHANLNAFEDTATEANAELELLNEKYSALEGALQAKTDKEETLVNTITKLEKELVHLQSERDELKHNNNQIEATLKELSYSKNENLREEILKIEQANEQKFVQLEQRNKKLVAQVEQKTEVAEAAEAIIANLKETLSSSQHQNEYLINERDYLQKEIDKVKKEMTRTIEDLDRRASVEVNSLSDQLESVTVERNKMASKCEDLVVQVKEAQEVNKTLKFDLTVVESEVASLKEVNADLHINLEKFEDQKVELSKQLQTAREGHQEKIKKITDDLEKEKMEKSKSEEVAIKLKAELASLSTTNKSLTAACTEYEENISKLKKNINQLIEERDELQAAFGNQDEAVATIAKERDRLQGETTRMASEIREYEKMKEEYQRVKHHVQRQSMELEDTNREQQHLQRRLDRTTRENKELTEEVNSLKHQSDRLLAVEHELRAVRHEKADLENDYSELVLVRDEFNKLKRETAGLAKENEELSRQNEEKIKKLAEYDQMKSEHEQLKSTNALQEGEIIKLYEELMDSKELLKIQEEDIAKLDEEIVRLQKEVEDLNNKYKELESSLSSGDGGHGSGSSSAILKQKDVEIRILREKNASLEKAAGTLAMQVTQLCDAVEKSRELENAYGTLDLENERLANEVKILEGELNARETEIENVLSDNEHLVLKLNSMGLRVKLTEEGINFVEGTE